MLGVAEYLRAPVMFAFMAVYFLVQSKRLHPLAAQAIVLVAVAAAAYLPSASVERFTAPSQAPADGPPTQGLVHHTVPEDDDKGARKLVDLASHSADFEIVGGDLAHEAWRGPPSNKVFTDEFSFFITLHGALPAEATLIEILGVSPKGGSQSVRLGIESASGTARVVARYGADEIGVDCGTHESVRTLSLGRANGKLHVAVFDHFNLASSDAASVPINSKVAGESMFRMVVNKGEARVGRIVSLLVYSAMPDGHAVRDALRKTTMADDDLFRQMQDEVARSENEIKRIKTVAPFVGVTGQCDDVTDWSRFDPGQLSATCRSAVASSCATNPKQALCGCWDDASPASKTAACAATRMVYEPPQAPPQVSAAPQPSASPPPGEPARQVAADAAAEYESPPTLYERIFTPPSSRSAR